MAFKRSFLAALGIEPDKIDEIMNAHLEVVNGLKADLAEAKEKADSVDKLTADLADAKKKLEQADSDNFKKKYEDEKAAFDKYKEDVASKETLASKKAAYTAMLKELGVPENWHSRVMRGLDFGSIELDSDGKIKDSAKAAETVKAEWSDVIPTVKEEGADTPTPPAGGKAPEKKGSNLGAEIAKAYYESHYGKKE